MRPPFLLGLATSECFAQAKPHPDKAGPEIIAGASGELIEALTEAIAIGVCSERAPEIAENAHGVTLRRASDTHRQPETQSRRQGHRLRGRRPPRTLERHLSRRELIPSI